MSSFLSLPYPGPPIHCAVLQSNDPACFTSLLHSSLVMRSARSMASARLSNSKYLSSASIRLPASTEISRQAVRVSLRCTSFIGASIAVMGPFSVVAKASIKSAFRPMVAVRHEKQKCGLNYGRDQMKGFLLLRHPFHPAFTEQRVRSPYSFEEFPLGPQISGPFFCPRLCFPFPLLETKQCHPPNTLSLTRSNASTRTNSRLRLL